jgi:hypothetical protein
MELFGGKVYSMLCTLSMNAPTTPQSILEQIAQIQLMMPGKLCVLREGPKGPYYNLQSWEEGKNHACYVPQQKVEAVTEAIDGYQRFEQLTEQYAQLIIEKTRAKLAVGVKKKTRRPAKSPAASS